MFDDDDDEEEPGSYQSVSVSLFDARLQIVCISFPFIIINLPPICAGTGAPFSERTNGSLTMQLAAPA